MSTPMSGRRAEAARNDEKILEAAREVFLADPDAPISAVAERADVGISALYRRYPGKERLLQALAGDGLERFKADLESALADERDPWTAYAECLQRVLAGRSQALAQRVAGRFAPTAELTELAADAGRLYTRLHRRTQRAGALRADVTTADVVLLLETLSLVELPVPGRDAALRRRYLALFLQALRAPSSGPAEPLPGPRARDKDLAARWQPGVRPRSGRT
ncbi:MAG TPA: TetR/AcrR family transcriptional regulator [Jatrophihabitans sp.]|nr:TetR/AcrR family transcriptional regulator [Jatrophihabitans sp.]